MSLNKTVQKYISLCREYGVKIDIQLVHGDAPKQQVDGNTVTLNIDKLAESDFENLLSYNIRKVIVPQMTLTTNRLILRSFENDDAKDCFEFLSDKQTCYDDGGYEPFAEMDEKYFALMNKFANQPMRKMIALKSTGKVIGTINLFEVNDRAANTFEIGYVISPNYRRKGYAYEAVSAICDCLLNDLNLNMIIAGAIQNNLPSNNLLQKLGFRFEGRKTKSFYHPECGAVDLLYYIKER